MTSCFVYKVIRDLESIDHLCINPIHRIGVYASDLSVRIILIGVYKLFFYLTICKQNTTSLSLFAGRTVGMNYNVKH